MLFKNQQELKHHLGFLDAGTSLQNLKTDLELSTESVKRAIGKEIYDAAESFYNDYYDSYLDPPTDATPLQRAMSKLVQRIQLPIILNAYLAFAPNNDLTHHGSKGRQNQTGENEKPASEWQIVRDENALKNREQRAMEELLRWLEENTQELITYQPPITLKPGKYYTNTTDTTNTTTETEQTGNSVFLALKETEIPETDPPTLTDLLRQRKVSQVYQGDIPARWDMNKTYQPGAITLGDDDAGYVAITESTGQNPVTSPDDWGIATINPALITQYKFSKAWQENNSLIVNRAELFDEIFPIEKSYRLFNILTPFIRRAESQTITPLIGKTAIKELLERRRKGNLTEEDTDLIGYLKPPIVMTAMARAIRSLSATLLPDGLLKQFANTSSKSSSDYIQRNQLALTLDEMADSDTLALKQYLEEKEKKEEEQDTTTPFDPLQGIPQNDENNNFFQT